MGGWINGWVDLWVWNIVGCMDGSMNVCLDGIRRSLIVVGSITEVKQRRARFIIR